jgi:hypothetical protein
MMSRRAELPWSKNPHLRIVAPMHQRNTAVGRSGSRIPRNRCVVPPSAQKHLSRVNLPPCAGLSAVNSESRGPDHPKEGHLQCDRKWDTRASNGPARRRPGARAPI